MKKRIVALILTVVMSLLALSSCTTSFDFVEEDLSAYATFDYEAFKAALAKLEIEDGEFTTDGETRDKIIAATIYNAIADKIVADTDEDERLTEGTLTEGDVLYFVYYAVDKVDENGNPAPDANYFFADQMNKTTLTSAKATHTLKLDDYLEGEGDEFIRLVAENLAKDVDIKDYIHTILTASDLQTKAEEALKAEKPDATDAEIKAAKAEAIKVKVGDIININYTRTYKKVDAEGVETTVTEKASYEFITLDAENPLHKFFLDADAVANVGSTLEAVTGKNGDTVTKAKKFDVEIDGVKYTYSDVKINWKVDGMGAPIASFEYTPYADIEAEKKEVAPHNLSTSGTTVDLKDKALTYYVFPVYAIDAPSYEEITADHVLYYIYSSKLTEKSFDAFKEEYQNGSDKIADLLADVADIFDTKKENNEFYKEGSDIKNLLNAYDKAVKDGGSSPNAAQKETISKAQEALTDAQNELLKGVIAKITAATCGDKKLGDEILKEYYEANEHSLKESYDSDIVKKVQKAVWELINDEEKGLVKVTGYPEKLLKDYTDHLYESYEYDFYKGDFDKDSSNYDEYGTLEKFLDKQLEAELKEVGKGNYTAALEIQAKEALEPIIKIYVVAKACEADAVKVMLNYVERDEDLYKIDEEYYKETYGDKAAEKIKEALEQNKESFESAKKDANKFLIDRAYMDEYKKEVGNAYYDQICDQYGEINIRAAFQFNRLFYYLTSTDYEWNEEEGHTEVKYTEDGKFLNFRTVKYTIKVDTETETESK